MNRQVGKTTIFYGWWIAGVAFVNLFLGLGIGYYTFSVFLKPLIQEFGWSRTETAMASTLLIGVVGIFAPIVGFLIDKYGSKKIIITGAIVTGASLIFASQVNTLWQIYAIYTLLGAGVCALTTVSHATLLSQWFIENRGLAIGIMQAGVGLGGATMVPLTNLLIQDYGWRGTYLAQGLLVTIIALPVSVLLIKNRPEDLGLLPDGRKRAGSPVSAVAPDPLPLNPAGLTLSQTLQTLTFWLLLIGFFLAIFGHIALVVHLVAFLTDLGRSPQASSIIFGLLVFAGIFGRLGFGLLADKYPKRYTAIVVFLFHVIGVGSLLLVPFSGVLPAFIIFFGSGLGGVYVLLPLLVADYFGLLAMGKILGVLLMVTAAGGSIGPVAAGYVFDMTGSYRIFFFLLLFTYSLATAAISFARPVQAKTSSISGKAA